MKLDQIPKKNLFNAPEGYFDKLPAIVQARIEAQKPVSQSQVYGRFALRYALPVVLIVVGVLWYNRENSGTVKFEREIASLNTQDLEFYLEEFDISNDELIETVNPINIRWSPDELDALENSIYESYGLSDSAVDGLLDVIEVAPLNDSVQ